MDLNQSRILVIGSSGLLGSALCRLLKERDLSFKGVSSRDYNVLNVDKVKDMFDEQHPNIVFNLFCSFGGILNNVQKPGSIFIDNLQGNINIINACRDYKVEKLIQASSQCVYGDTQPVPFLEEEMWWYGKPSKNNESYGISKRVLHTTLEAYNQEFGLNGVILVPSNMYGPYDNFARIHTHVVPALIRRIIEAKENNLEEVEIYGDGESSRELLFVEDAAEAFLLAAENYNSTDAVNIGTGQEIKIKDLVGLLVDLIGYTGKILYNNKEELNGQRRRVSSIEKAKERFGFTAKTSLEEGLKRTIDYFLENRSNLREKVIYGE